MPRRVQMDIQPFGKATRIDREKRVMYGAQVMILGEAKGHGVEIDRTALQKIVELGNAAPKGVKSRFGHPNMCNPGLGTFLGRRTNFSLKDGVVRSDFHISDAAPADMVEHVLAMAEKEPDMLGNSVVIEAEHEYRVDDKGVRLRDESGEPLMPLLRPKALFAVDVVDEPASGTGMFAAPVEGVQFSPTTMVELERAMSKPDFRKRVISFFGWMKSFDGHDDGEGGDGDDRDPEIPETDTNETETPEETPEPVEENPEMTLAELKAKHPEAFAEYASELKVSFDKERDAAVSAERARCTTILSKCDAEHHARTKEHPEGFAQHAVKEGLSLEQSFSGLMDLTKRKSSLQLLESDSGENHIDPAAPPAGGGDPKQQFSNSLQAVAERLAKQQ